MRISLLALCLLFLSFNYVEQQNDSIRQKLIGKWRWFESGEGWGGESRPESVGYQQTLEFTPDAYCRYKNDTLIKCVSYEITEGKDGAIGMLSLKNYVAQEIFFNPANDTLILREYCADCSESLYVRIK